MIRYKERNPTPFNNIDLLFEYAYRQIIEASLKREKKQQQLKEASMKLSCATSLILLLAKLNLEMPDKEFELLKNYLSPNVVDSDEMGWEEITDASMCQLLKTSLAKNTKEQNITIQPIKFPKDIKKVQKHIAGVFDRLLKGGSLLPNKKEKKEKKVKK